VPDPESAAAYRRYGKKSTCLQTVRVFCTKKSPQRKGFASDEGNSALCENIRRFAQATIYKFRVAGFREMLTKNSTTYTTNIE